MPETHVNQPQISTQDPGVLFTATFDHPPQYIVTSPGRVNLIGEHTDYNLLPVLPMPIDRAIRIAVSPRNDATVCFANANDRFAPFKISISEPIQSIPGHWGNYCRAAIRAVIAQLHDAGATPRGFNALVQSDLPPASGLSSSSALVIGTCLAMLQSNDVHWTPNEVAERMRIAEQFVGTAGGGMDQAVIALGQPDSALVIEFDPLQAQPARIPDNIAIFVINSGQKAEKTGAARYNYNRRALECAIAVELLNRSHTASTQESPLSAGGPQTSEIANLSTQWTSLRDIYHSVAANAAMSAHSTDQCDLSPDSRPTLSSCWPAFLLRHLRPDPLTIPQLEILIGRETLARLCASKKLDLDAAHEWLPDGLLQVYPRAAHVLAETDRVYALRDAFARNDREAAFHVSRAGHASCRDLYHISTPQIEYIIQAAYYAGAGSARITGAGFGGCIVALVPAENADTFSQKLQAQGIPAKNIIKAKSQGGARVTPAK